MKTNVFNSGRDGYHTYRIPAVLVAPDGSLLAFCEGRRNNRSDHGDIDLLVKRSGDGGNTWSAQRVVYSEPGEITIGNPCPVVDVETGTVRMLFCSETAARGPVGVFLHCVAFGRRGRLPVRSGIGISVRAHCFRTFPDGMRKGHG